MQVHVIARIEQHENIRAGHREAKPLRGVRWRRGDWRRAGFSSRTPGVSRTIVLHDLRSSVAFFKRGQGLWNAIFGNREVLRAQARDVIPLAVRHRNVQLHQVDIHADDVLVLLRVLCRRQNSGYADKSTTK